MKIFESLTRFVQGSALVIALTFLVVGHIPSLNVGGNINASTPEQFVPPPLMGIGGVSCDLETKVPETLPQFGYAYTNGFLYNFWECVIYDQATCGFWGGIVCTALAVIIEAALWAIPGVNLVKVFVAGAKSAIKRGSAQAIRHLINMLNHLGSHTIPASRINNVIRSLPIPRGMKNRFYLRQDIVVDFTALARMLERVMQTEAWAIVQFFTLWGVQQGRRVCKCVLC